MDNVGRKGSEGPLCQAELGPDSQPWGFSMELDVFSKSSKSSSLSQLNGEGESSGYETGVCSDVMIHPIPKLTRCIKIRKPTTRTSVDNQENNPDWDSSNTRFCQSQPAIPSSIKKIDALSLKQDKSPSPVEWFRKSLNTTLCSESPSTPLKRLQKRLAGSTSSKQKTFSDMSKDHGENKSSKYQTLLTEYFKAKREIQKLRIQTKNDQKRIAVLEWQRQQVAMEEKVQQPEVGNSSQEPVKNVKRPVTGTQGDYGSSNEHFNTQNSHFRYNRERFPREEDIGCESSDMNVVESFKNEVAKCVAETIADQSLRSTTFQISVDSPPSKIPSIVDTLSRSGRYCVRCGTKTSEFNVQSKK